MSSNIICINDEKFKSIFVSVNFVRKLNREEAGKNALLASILKKGTNNLNTEKELELELSRLYYSTIDVNVDKIGGLYNVEFGAEFINKKYIDEDVMEKVINILYDVIYNPYMQNGTFSKEIFNSEKAALIEKINQEKNDKRRWALRRLEEEMHSDNDYGVSTLGDIKRISEETLESLFQYYKEFLQTSEVKIVVTGNLSGYDNIKEILEDKFIKNTNTATALEINNRNELRKVEDYEELNQSVLCFGLNIKNTSKEKMPIIAVYNSILGGTPASKLFQNVREKESLAYFAKSQYMKYINAIYIYSGINLDKVEKATEVIQKQLKDIEDGNISEEELDTAKKNIILTYKSISDSKVVYNRIILSNELYYGTKFDINKFIQEIENVTVEDIKEIAKNIEINTIYLLGGKINE